MPLNREEAVDCIIQGLRERDVVVGTTGMLSRELFELREAYGHGHEKDFLTVGSMGHASSIALGVAMQRPRRQVKKYIFIELLLLFLDLHSPIKNNFVLFISQYLCYPI